jgi:hypothetical protein
LHVYRLQLMHNRYMPSSMYALVPPLSHFRTINLVEKCSFTIVPYLEHSI